MIALEARVFCPVAVLGETYHEATCRARGCTVCADLLIHPSGGAK